MRKKKKEEMFYLPDTPDRLLNHKSGWCMTNYHEGCPHKFVFGICGCDCHKEKK
jgi:hypothetical protein